MRQSAVAFAAECEQRFANSDLPDVVFTTDMLSLAEFRGLCPLLAIVPVVVYFHENQLTYPDSPEESANVRQPVVDMQPAFSNFCSALAATEVWFNSNFHRQDYLAATREWLSKMPDGNLAERVDEIQSKSSVQYPPVELLTRASTISRTKNPPHIVWVARWEHDKRPDIFFAALQTLKDSGFEFRLSVLGETHAQQAERFAAAHAEFQENIEVWGYQDSRNDYERVLQSADIVVSTAVHEFFGIAIVEAVSAGCCPVVPNSLAYPEVLGTTLPVFHDGTIRGVASAIRDCAESLGEKSKLLSPIAEAFSAQKRVAEMDTSIERVAV